MPGRPAAADNRTQDFEAYPSRTAAMSPRIVALAGRPNTGKTTLFNALTGMRQKVANFAGCTVEKAVGQVTVEREDFEVIDLPGTHSLLPETSDEKVAFNFLTDCINEGSDLLVLCVAEASNIENDLALAAGLKAAGYPIAVVVNMIDEARLNDVVVDPHALSEVLGAPVVLASARLGEGLGQITALLTAGTADGKLVKALDFRLASPARLRELQALSVLTAARAYAKAVRVPPRVLLPTLARSISVDRVVFHPLAGPLILTVTMFLLFQALFTGAKPLMDFLNSAFAAFSDILRARLPAGSLSDFICDGALPGLAAVVVFVPQIAILFTLIGILEHSGYLPRAGAMLDRALRPFGLDGKVFIPFLSGFACAIPGIMATRTISSEKRRIVAILLTPLMTCSARLPVYALIITAFVPETFRPLGLDGRGVVMAGMYAFGIVAALLLALALKWTRLYESAPPPITVLPPYRLPRLRELGRYVWSRCWHFISRAGQVILMVSVVLWALASYPRPPSDLGHPTSPAVRIEGSMLGMAGRAIEPLFRPLGWDWRVSVAVLSSLAAREVFVGTLGTLYAMDGSQRSPRGLERELHDAKKADGTPRYTLATAVGLLIFFAIALQCLSTVAIVRRETGSSAWPTAQFAFLFVLAYTLSFAAVRLLS